jgi:pimeloyl-ACP methyl ester carboxylesterase
MRRLTGSTLYLLIPVPLALFSVGDGYTTGECRGSRGPCPLTSWSASSLALLELYVLWAQVSTSGKHKRWAEEVTKLLPKGRLVVIEGAYHDVQDDAPEELAREIYTFLIKQLPEE